jgi:hypothetical protein
MTVSATKRPECIGSREKHDPMAASTTISAGDAVCLDSSGNAVPASATTGLVARGVAQHSVDNSTGLAGDLSIDSVSGIFGFSNKSGDEVTAAEIGDVCYFSQATEVCKTGTGKSVAGVVEKIENSLVYVHVAQWPLQVGLLAASNLSDVGSAATARANIGANTDEFTGSKISSKASDAEVFRWVAGRAGTITGLKTVLNGALATGDATVQLKVAGSNCGSTTTGLITQTQSASAAGDVDTCTPLTTNLTFSAGDVISVTVGGASTATATFNATVSYTY